MIDNYVSICKLCKNYLQNVDDTKKYLQTIQRVFADNAKSIAHNTKKVFADDTKSICKRYKKYLQTIRGAYQKRRQSEIGSLRTQPPASWKVSFLVCGTSFRLFSQCIFLQHRQKCIYFSLSIVPGSQAVIIVCSVIVREKNQPHTSANATA